MHASANISFQADAALVAQLLQALQQEQQALIAADLAAIEAMLDGRNALLQSISMVAHQRYEALAAAGYPASEAGMAAWLAQQQDARTQQDWTTFQQQLAQAKELNRVNGLLINKHFQRNQERLDSLHGRQSSAQFYGKNGQHQHLGGLRGGLTA